MPKKSGPGERYVELVLAMRDHLGSVRGWQARVARALGVNPTYISMIATGARKRVGGRAIEAAVAHGVPRALFRSSAPVTDADAEAVAKLARVHDAGSRARDEQFAFWSAARRAAAGVATKATADRQADAYRGLARFVLRAPEQQHAHALLATERDVDVVSRGSELAAMVLAIASALDEEEGWSRTYARDDLEQRHES